jgi:hypothetical protein
MITYHTLTEPDLHTIARERVRELETAHFAHHLKLAEALDPAEQAALQHAITDLERRIQLHLTETPPESDNPAAEPPDDDRSETNSDTNGRAVSMTDPDAVQHGGS